MITLGIDAVEIERFTHWHLYSQNSLKRIFTDKELEYCLSNKAKSAERFAVRFAAKEALFKALSNAGSAQLSFLTLCKSCEILKNSSSSAAELIVQESTLAYKLLNKWRISLSLTHTKTIALAAIIIY